MLLVPNPAYAGFFSDLVSNFIDNTLIKPISASTEKKDDSVVYNSQNIPLLEVEPVIKDNFDIEIVESQALQTVDFSTGIREINPYIFSSADKILTYIVKKGDTLGEIAEEFGISTKTILFSNTDIRKDVLKIGQTLVILPIDGMTYTVKKGDTLSGIARRYKVSSNQIMEYNGIKKARYLQIGDTLILPGGVASAITQSSSNKITKVDDPKKYSDPTEGYIWPLPVGIGRISQRLHGDRAVDIAAPKGSPIYSIADGTVLVSRNFGYGGGYGRYVIVNFDNGAQAIFAHMSEAIAKTGQRVKQGEVIGLVGSTGRSTGNHIHLGFRGGYANPWEHLPLYGKGY
ncbi:MAG: M23 family metallopeptidase [Patescibacteria group bacterium]|nr:M23 family metallopeptidase [Patescibacteria group bacterium]